MEDINEIEDQNGESEDSEMEVEEEERKSDEAGTSEGEAKTKRKVYLPGDPLKEGEELVYDPSAYVMLHEAHAGYPCLSFDIVNDGHGVFPNQFPATAYFVGGTQTENPKDNKVLIMKVSNMQKTLKESNESDDSDEESSDSEDEDPSKKPVMQQSHIKHNGIVNRLRVKALTEYKLYAGVWSDTGKVSILDIRPHLQHLDSGLKGPLRGKKGENAFPAFIFEGHGCEGYAIDWSPVETGALATGDCKKNIFLWSPSEGSWSVSERPLEGHKASVEDIQWSPNEANVLASCSVDRSIRVWDTRQTEKSQLSVEKAHGSDVNVISWNREVPLIASGGDDGVIHVWDLRQFKKGGAVASLKHHSAPVCTLEWCPGESSVFASGGEDHQIALWDLAVEREADEAELKDLPPQLLFIHQGQTDIKELHWHPQYPGLVFSTANSGFNFFKTISI